MERIEPEVVLTTLAVTPRSALLIAEASVDSVLSEEVMSTDFEAPPTVKLKVPSLRVVEESTALVYTDEVVANWETAIECVVADAVPVAVAVTTLLFELLAVIVEKAPVTVSRRVVRSFSSVSSSETTELRAEIRLVLVVISFSQVVSGARAATISAETVEVTSMPVPKVELVPAPKDDAEIVVISV
jgi:hypothetical protein